MKSFMSFGSKITLAVLSLWVAGCSSTTQESQLGANPTCLEVQEECIRTRNCEIWPGNGTEACFAFVADDSQYLKRCYNGCKATPGYLFFCSGQCVEMVPGTPG